MRKSIRFTLPMAENESIEVEVYEVRPKDVLDLHKRIQSQGLPLGTYGDLLPKCCNLPVDKLLNLYPSELEFIVDKFKEVNKSFLAPWPTLKKVIEGVGLGKWLAEIVNESKMLDSMKQAIINDWKKLAVDLSAKAIENRGNMDGPSSILPSDT